MGYYTNYSMVVQGANPQTIQELNKVLDEKNLFGYAFDREPWEDSHGLFNYYSDDCRKWYEHDEDMLEISKKFPEMTFKLHGDGEDSDDIWDTYYKNGQLEECQWGPKYPTKIEWKEYIV